MSTEIIVGIGSILFGALLAFPLFAGVKRLCSSPECTDEENRKNTKQGLLIVIIGLIIMAIIVIMGMK